MSKAFYVTTPIYYVNGLPHVGHAYTTIAADVLTRWHRLRGRAAYFLTGTDEHGQKVLEKARERGMEPLAHCDDMVVHWKATFAKLHVNFDRFFRTTDADHVACVQAVLQSLYDKGEIYSKDYEGWYYTPDEVFVTEKDLEDDAAGLKYDRSKLVRLTEKNWFFKMGSYQERLLAHIHQHPTFIAPESRKNEVLGFLKKPLEDLCISRPKARMSWGVEIPFDRDYVTYVWFDALLNYLSATGWTPASAGDSAATWPPDVQLLGKDILTTHAVYWSTMLMALGVPLPKQIFAHGWWTSSDGEKMSKSKGNVIDVNLLVDAFGVDALRWFVLREIAFGADGGFSYEGFQIRYNADLANDMGNMSHRGLSMTRNWLGGTVPEQVPGPAEVALSETIRDAVRDYASKLEALNFKGALDACARVVEAGNLYIDREQPWALNKNKDPRLATVLRTVLELTFVAATLALPVMPVKAAELLRRLGRSEDDAKALLTRVIDGDGFALEALPDLGVLDVGEPLFPRFRDMPESIAALFASEAPTEKVTKEDAPTERVSKPKAAAQAPEAAAPPKVDKAAAAADPGAPIDYDTFSKVKLRVGKVLAAEKHPKADKLLVLQVDVGEASPRQIVAGIATKFAPNELVGRTVVVVANLAPVKLRGVESQGMLLAAGTDAVVDLVTVAADPGEVVR